MARRSKIESLGEFTGVDLKTSEARRSPHTPFDAQNFQFGETDNLVGRKGYQVDSPIVFQGGTSYSYLNRTTGATEEEAVAVSRDLWKRYEGSFQISYSGSGDSYYTMYPNTSGSYTFTLYTVISGVTTAVLTKTCSSSYTIFELATDIDALANFSVSDIPAAAKVNGTQTGVYTIGLDSGHGISVGDEVVFYTTNLGWVSREINATTALSISFDSAIYQSVSVVDNQYIGLGSVPSNVAFVRRSVSTNLHTVYFPYWKIVKFNRTATYAPYPFYSGHNASNRQSYSFINANDVLYIGQTRIEADPLDRTDSDGALLKYDGNRIYRAGLPTPSISSVTPSGGSNSWRYIVTYEQVDHQGNIIESNPSTISSVSSAGLNVSVAVNCIVAASSTGCWFNVAYADVNGNQSGAGTTTGLDVNSGHTIKAGDKVTFYDAVSGEVVERTITSVTTTRLTWASTTAVSVSNSDPISVGLKIKLWRTKNLGVDFYLVQERVNKASASTTTLLDNVADASLLIKYEFPEEGREHDLPPPVNFLCLHQGCLVGAGDRANPNTAFWSLPGNLEYWPESTNFVDIPSTKLGPITAIGSDSDSRLALFKKNAYYDIEGDLDSSIFSVKAVTEGDYGVIAHSSLARVKDLLIGISNYGPIAIRDGVLSSRPGLPIRPAFTNSRFSNSITNIYACNDSHNLLFRFYVVQPDTSATSMYVADYEGDTLEWFPWTLNGVNPDNGFIVTSENLYHIGSSGVCREISSVFQGSSGDNYEDSYIYHDNGAAISYRLEFTGLHDGNLIGFKQFERLFFFSFDSIHEPSQVVSDITLETYRNSKTAPADVHSYGTSSYPTGEYVVHYNLRDGKAKTLNFIYGVSAIFSHPVVSGYLLLFTKQYNDDEFAE